MPRLVTRDFLAATYTGFKSLFDKTLAAAEPVYPKIATVVESGSDKQSYNWLGAAPALREWVDERVPGALRTHAYEVANRNQDGTFPVPEISSRITGFQMIFASPCSSSFGG